MNRPSSLAAVLTAACLAGCANNDIFLRPERTAFLPLSDQPDGVSSVPLPGGDVKLTCLDWRGNVARRAVLDPRPQFSDTQCLYAAVDIKSVAESFKNVSDEEELKRRRNYHYSFLRALADHNCQTFLGRSFANKASLETARSTFQDVLTGSAAAVANAQPPTAAGLSLVNLFAGKTIDNVNATFYYEKTFQAMAAAIAIERDVVRKEMDPKIERPYGAYTIFDVLNDVRRYDDACSVRVGVAKLQELAQNRKADEELQARTLEAGRTIDAQKANLESQRKLIDEQRAQLGELRAQLAKTQLGLQERGDPALAEAGPQPTRAP